MHHGKDRIEAALAEWKKQGLLPCPVQTVDQGEPLGTGHAVQQAVPALERLAPTGVVILYGDVPLLSRESVARLAAQEAALLAMDLQDPTGYGRVIQNADGTLRGLVEQKDASLEILAIRRVNGGAYALPWAELEPALAGLSNQNAQGESLPHRRHHDRGLQGAPAGGALRSLGTPGHEFQGGPGPAPEAGPGPHQ